MVSVISVFAIRPSVVASLQQFDLCLVFTICFILKVLVLGTDEQNDISDLVVL